MRRLIPIVLFLASVAPVQAVPATGGAETHRTVLLRIERDEFRVVAVLRGEGRASAPLRDRPGADFRIEALDASGAVVHRQDAYDPRRVWWDGPESTGGLLRMDGAILRVVLPGGVRADHVRIAPAGRPDAARIVALPLAAPAPHVPGVTSTTMRAGGPVESSFDIAFLGDGYRAAEMSQYHEDIDRMTAAMMDDPAFGSYRDSINIHRVDVVSNESGADNLCTGHFVDTALDTAHQSTGSDCRLLYSTNESKVYAAAAAAPAADLIVVIVNTEQYGGAGGGVSYSYRGSTEVMLHEVGHTHGRLADEYGGPGTYTGGEPAGPNVTINLDRETLKWNHWVAAHTPLPTFDWQPDVAGAYEGGFYRDFGVYRATAQSKMRVNGAPFERVNHEQLVARLSDWLASDETGPVVGVSLISRSGNTVRLAITISDPESHVLGYRLAERRSMAGSAFERANDEPSFAATVNRTVTHTCRPVHVEALAGNGARGVGSVTIDPDTIAPGSAGRPYVDGFAGETFTLQWAPASDDCFVDRYEVSVRYPGSEEFNAIASVDGTHYTMGGLAEGEYAFSVRAFDGAGNAGLQSGVGIVRVDYAPPTPPVAPVALPPYTAGPAVMAWGPSSDSGGVDHYVVGYSIDGGEWTEHTVAAPFSVFTLPPGESWFLRVEAVDVAGRHSDRVAAVQQVQTL